MKRKDATVKVEALQGAPARQWLWTAAGLLALALLWAGQAGAQSAEDRPLIDVQRYDIEGRIDPGSSTLQAQAKVTFIPREATNHIVMELHNGLDVRSVKLEDGTDLSPLRYRQDSSVRVTFPDQLVIGQPMAVTFEYEGQLKGYENSPVEGLDLASIAPDGSYLLYPGRWFPVNGYGADQFAASIRITTPPGYKGIGSGLGGSSEVVNGVEHKFEFSQQSFPGSVAFVKGEPTRAEKNGVTTTVYFQTASEDLARAYGEATGEIMADMTERFGSPYSQSLTLVEIGDYGPEAFAAPGVIFMSPYGIRQAVNRRLLGTQVAHQWWRSIVTPGNRRHVWLDHGLAWYSALLEIQDSQGQEAFDQEIQATRVEALTYNEIPIIQSDRLPEFSPELDALAGAKGAMVMNMLRWMITPEKFDEVLKTFASEYAYKSATTQDFQELAERVTGRDLSPFFIQWIESVATPEFTQEYTIYRLGQGKGFRVLGKVKQDMDTFSMPVELRIDTEGEPEYRTINVVGASSDYSVEAFGKPKKVELDPNNRILRFDDDIRVKVAIRKGEQLVELGYYTDALQEYQKSLDINRYSSLAHYRIGEVFFLQNNYQSAANEFRESINGDQQPEWTVVWAHINLGKIFDVTGQRDRAVNEYQLAIRTRDNTQNAQDEARKYLENPYRREKRQERIY
ncbi:MAG: peptidase M1 [Acidobacteria bacterium]|nr:peptidase M1 [Acidobacteriota bacterium]